MKISNLQTSNLRKSILFVRANWQTFFLISLLLTAFWTLSRVSAQTSLEIKLPSPSIFRVGERLSYNLSFEKFKNAGIAEFIVASSGKLGEKDAVELQSRVKTTELVSAAFILLDESRTTYASPDTGLPLYVRKISNSDVLPKENIYNFLVVPTANFDLLTLIYQARNSGGIGTFPLQEDDKLYSAAFQLAGSERVRTDTGEFATNISTVQSQFLVEKGITDLRINFSTDDARIPVLIRFRTSKGAFRAEISGIQTPRTESTPLPLLTPQPSAIPKPTPIRAYVENESLLPELAFKLGETLEYQISAAGKFLGTVTLQAKERKQFAGKDSLLLTAAVNGTQPNQQILTLNDRIETQVNPNTLAPYQFNIKFNGLFSDNNQLVQFEQDRGKAMLNGTNPIDIPVGTHNVLSLVYAIRSFNLRPSKDERNPVNDTRVAVFLGSNANVFTLRPSTAEIVNLKGEKISAQLITVITGNPQIDMQGLRLWLGTDENRLPLRLIIGNYQADLVSNTVTPLK